MIIPGTILFRNALLAAGLTLNCLIGAAKAIDFQPRSVNLCNVRPMATRTSASWSSLPIGKIGIVGASARDFGGSAPCRATLAPGGDCVVRISSGRDEAGQRSAAARLSDGKKDPAQGINASGSGLLMTLSPDRSHLVNTFTGKPVFITGDTAYNLAVQLASNADVEAYLSDRESKGINLIWVALVDASSHGEGRDYVGHTQNNGFGDSPWNGGPDFTGMGAATAYWRHVDYVLQRAAAHGITVLAGTAFIGTFDNCNSMYYGSIAKTTDATMTAYGEFLGNRYKSYPNIIWLQGGDANVSLCGQRQAEKVADIAKGIVSVDRRHLMTVEATTNVWGEASATNWSKYAFSSKNPAGWLTLGTIYPKGSPNNVFSAEIAQIVSQNTTETQAPVFVPYFSIEDSYEYEPWGAPYNDRQLRQQGYTEVLSGAHLGRVFGSSGVWTFGAGCCQHGSPWRVSMEHPSSFDQERLGRLFRSREHWKLVADPKHTVVTAGYGSGETLTVTSRTSDGQTIIAYIPNGNAATLTVDMAKITSSIHQATCWWFSPSSAAATLIGGYSNSGTRNFTPPDRNDWALVIDDASANLPPPGSEAPRSGVARTK
jgi:hypothetical protein